MMLSVNQVEELKLSLTCVRIHVIHCGGKNLHTVFAVSISWLLLYMLTLFSNRLGYSIVLLLYNLDFGHKQLFLTTLILLRNEKKRTNLLIFGEKNSRQT